MTLPEEGHEAINIDEDSGDDYGKPKSAPSPQLFQDSQNSSSNSAPPQSPSNSNSEANEKESLDDIDVKSGHASISLEIIEDEKKPLNVQLQEVDIESPEDDELQSSSSEDYIPNKIPQHSSSRKRARSQSLAMSPIKSAFDLLEKESKKPRLEAAPEQKKVEKMADFYLGREGKDLWTTANANGKEVVMITEEKKATEVVSAHASTAADVVHSSSLARDLLQRLDQREQELHSALERAHQAERKVLPHAHRLPSLQRSD